MNLDFITRRSQLVVENELYGDFVLKFFEDCLAQDLRPNGDLTSENFVSNKIVKAKIVIQESAYISGLEELKFLFTRLAPEITFFSGVSDGDFLKLGEVIAEISGPYFQILAWERTILNFLYRMSGITTEAKKWLQILDGLNSDLTLLATRKTYWGLLDKKAGVVAGAGAHRLNLSDAILIKDNHFESALVTLEKILNQNNLDFLKVAAFLEVEVGDELEFQKVFSLLEQFIQILPCIIMLDNFSPSEIIKTLQGKYRRHGIYFEASGEVSLDNLGDYAKTGVDFVSTSKFILNSKPIPFSLVLG